MNEPEFKTAVSFEKALEDPNLTEEERKQINDLHLNAMKKAQKVANMNENWSKAYKEALAAEFEKNAAVIQRILGHAANRNLRHVA
jgi:hypothetical protein